MSEDIKVTFVVSKNCEDENECSEDMQLAFIACEQHRCGGLQPSWVHETEFKKFQGLTKKDVFVLSEFSGEIFDKLRATKCLLLGPRCVSCCMTEGTPIPSGPAPVFTVGMRGLIVTASGLSKQQKEKIKQRVEWMGGIYNSDLTDATTHLVSATVTSDKYIKAVDKSIPVMSESWIEAVWEASLRLNINGASPDFKKHLLPPFHNLEVTTSGISKKEKQMIMKLVVEHGGSFSGAFQSETTDVVILTKEGIGSEKYKAALQYEKACAVPQWVKDSAARGIALPLVKYRVAGASTSSPISSQRLPDMSLNFSRITNIRPPCNFVDESRSVDMSSLCSKSKISQEGRKSTDAVDKDIQTAYENFNMSDIKKAGPIFDGFCIWVTGPDGVWRDKASAMVSRCGGVRFDAPHARVTHCVSGNVTCGAAAARAAPHAAVVSAMWLMRSVAEKQVLPHTDFLIQAQPSSPAPNSARQPVVEPSSPMSKRNLQLLRRTPSLQLQPPPPAAPPEPDDIVHHYLSQNLEPAREKTPEPAPLGRESSKQSVANMTDDVDEPTDEVEQIFAGIKIEVQGLDEEAICELGAEVAAGGGALVCAGSGGSFTLVPLEFDPRELRTPSAEAVTVFWLKDCLAQQELLPVAYYHRPVVLPRALASPLRAVVASLSTYSGVERAYLDELAKLLGATTQLRFCRRTTANAQASTHLICPEPVGDKYQGALKWGLPAVKAEWLLECAAKGRRVSEEPFLVGETRAPPYPADVTADANVSNDKSNDLPERNEKENAMLPPGNSVVPRRGSLNTEQTPKANAPLDVDADMSPASRYIAMARQGLLGGDSQETPKRVGELKDDARQDGELRTPPLDDALSTPNLRCLSPTTRRRLQAVKRGEMPSDPIRTPIDPFDKQQQTPDSAFGAALRPDSGRLSPDARKRLWQVVQELPSKEQHPVKEKQTPLSEIRNRFLAQFNGDAPTPPSDYSLAPRKLHLQDQVDTPPPSKIAKTSANQSAGSTSAHSADSSSKAISNDTSVIPAAVDAQLQRLSAALSGRNSSPIQRVRRPKDVLKIPAPGPESEAGPESQPNTVGWDDTTPSVQPVASLPPTQPVVKRFMLSSNVDNREEIMEMIVHLGGSVSDGTEFDTSASHLLCAAPGRSEKMLGAIASGKWTLHPAYVARSRALGAFLDEEEYEWGNPRATSLPQLSASERSLAAAAHRWRSSTERPLQGLVALLHVPALRRKLLSRLLQAGGGTAVEDEPPYSNEDINVCFADIKRCPLSEQDASWLMSRRIPVCAPVLLSSFLTDETRPNPREHCLPEFRPK